MLSKKQTYDVCLLGQESKSCRYLCEDKDKNFFCLKKTSKKQVIDVEIKDFLIFCKNKQIDPNDFYLPIGDNCQGYPFLKTLKQGYDIKED